MSKGLGRIQQKIDAIFTEDPDESFTIEELCQRVYDREHWIAKRHRVAVLRAAKVIAKRHPNIVCWRAEIRGRTVMFLNHASVTSYATARLKAERWGFEPLRDSGARHILREDERYVKLVSPGGAWWFHVQEWIAERSGDKTKLEELKPFRDALERESAGSMKALMERLRGR
jgi:hypothetical protein